ncbi:protein kinase domain-containing protein [Capilliphycus salinus ALCB114379]|uniref:protein kinase domain-containing protein n=1 Tax=Capilliphycus salinus TaxID=2768948 RepID=UPI0039A72A36
MSYCINPNCKHPQNSAHHSFCQSCGYSLRLKDRYRIIKVLGQSITSRTFLAVDEDQPSKSRCVIKQFRHRDQSPSSPAEGDAVNLRLVPLNSVPASELERLGRHEAIPELWASFAQENYHYYVHEYIPGRNLGCELDQDGIFREGQIWQLLNDVLPTLEFLHENNIVHADIKPENLIRRSPSSEDSHAADEPEIAVVDLASAIDPENALIVDENHQGSAEYSAPEHLHSQASPSSDLYSLGVTCLHLMTQVPAFDLYDVKSDTWVWRDYLKYPVSRRLGRILDKMVQRHPAKRYQSATEVMRDLKTGAVVAFNTLSTQQKLMLTAWGGAVVAIASLILSSIPSNVSRVSSQSPEPVYRLPDTRAYPPQIKRIPPQLKNTPAVRTLMRSFSPVWAIAVSPNGQLVASGNTDGTIQVLDIQTGDVLYTLSGHSGPVGALAISPNGRLLVSGSGDNSLKVWDLWSGKLIKMLYGHKAWVYGVAFSPDGETVASVSRDQSLRLWDVETSEEIGQLNGYAQDVQSVAFSPDRQTLVSGGSDGSIEVWNWRTGRLLRSIKGHPNAIWSVAISPDGRTLATGSWDRSIKLWDLNRLQSEYFSSLPERTLIGHGDKVQSLSFSRDGQTLASGDFAGTVKLWQIETGGLMGTLKGHKSWVDVEFSPVDNSLVSGSFDDTVKVWRLSP